MSSGVGLPNLLRTDVMNVPVNQRLETDIIYPITANQHSAKWVFDRKGILDSNSCINIAATLPFLEADGAAAGAPFTDSKSSLPSTIGALALIKRAYLEIGGRRVATLDEVGQYNTWKRLHLSGEYKEGVLQVKQGGSDVFVGSASAAYPPVNDGTIGRRSNETSQLANAWNTTTEAHRVLTNDANTTPGWCVSLAQLIPMLKGFQIPLFAIAQEVSLTIEFQEPTVGSTWVVSRGWAVNAGAASAKTSIVIPQLYLMADYLFYPGKMENLGAAITSPGGYDLLYDEVQTQSSFLGQAGAAATSFDKTIQLALGGKKVKSIVRQRVAIGTYFENQGDYYSSALGTSSKYNYTIDSKPFYSQDLENPALQFSETCRIDNTPLRVPQVRYSFGAGQGFTGRYFNGFSQADETGSQKWTGLRLANSAGIGQRMSNLPILYREYGALTGGEAITPYTLRFFITCQRMINISNGMVVMVE